MATHYKIVVDCADPHRLAGFWADALGYVVEDNSNLIAALLERGAATEDDVVDLDGRRAWRTAVAVRDPDAAFDAFSGMGQGGRVLSSRSPRVIRLK